MFIDSQQVSVFYDAVVGPAFRTVELQVSASQTDQLEKSAAGHLNAGLPALFPWLKIGADVEARRAAVRGRQDGQSITVQPIDSAARSWYSSAERTRAAAQAVGDGAAAAGVRQCRRVPGEPPASAPVAVVITAPPMMIAVQDFRRIVPPPCPAPSAV